MSATNRGTIRRESDFYRTSELVERRIEIENQ